MTQSHHTPESGEMLLAPLKEKYWYLSAACNDRSTLEQNLLASPSVQRGQMAVRVAHGCRSASAAYTSAASGWPNENLWVFAHQDVYLPRGWSQRLAGAVAWLEEHDPQWGVIGLVGVTAGGESVGRVWSSGLGREVGRPVTRPTPAASIDEMVIVLRGGSGLRFDEGLPGFHLYGTDIVLEAKRRGMGTYVIDAPAIHNSRPVRRLDKGYMAAYRYMQRKWAAELPLQTCVVPVTRTAWPVYRHRLRGLWRRLRGRGPTGQRVSDPAALARELGYEKEEG